MKKVKIMLLSLLVLAVAGGALAFKAKFNKSYCTTFPIDDGAGLLICPNTTICPELQNSTTINGFGNGEFLCITPKPNGVNCNQITTCRTLTTVKSDVPL